MKAASPKLSRRNFLLAVSAGGAATAAAVIGKTTSTATVQQPGGDGKRRGKGYQESAHVRRYYDTTKI